MMETLTHRLYTPTDLDAAYERWGCNCGPASVAALLGLECEAVRPHFQGFETRHYANPTHVQEALTSLDAIWTRSAARPVNGLLFIQWGGPWLQPGVPVGAAYRHTHWIAVNGEAVFDVNAGHWISRADWEDPKDGVAAWIMRHNKRCDQTWSVRSQLLVLEKKP